jgi:hypothetical protein
MTPVRTAGRASNPRSAPRASQSAKRPSGAVPTAGRSSSGRSAANGRSMRRRASACVRCVPTDRRHADAGNELGLEHSAPYASDADRRPDTNHEYAALSDGREKANARCARKGGSCCREPRGRAGGARLAGVFRRVLSGQPPTQPQGDSGVRCLQTFARRRRAATRANPPA